MLGMGEDKQDVFVVDLESLEGDIEDYTKKPNTITLVNPTYYLSLHVLGTFTNPFLLTLS